MATCPYTQGYDKDANCPTFAGGVKYFGFLEGYNKNTITIAAGIVTALVPIATKSFRVFKVKKNKSAVTDNGTRTEAGAKSYKPTIVMFLGDLSTALRQEIDLHMQNVGPIIFMDSNNVWRLAGYYNGMEVTTVDANFGTLIGDSHAQTITYVGEEIAPMYELNSSVVTSLALPTT